MRVGLELEDEFRNAFLDLTRQLPVLFQDVPVNHQLGHVSMLSDAR